MLNKIIIGWLRKIYKDTQRLSQCGFYENYKPIIQSDTARGLSFPQISPIIYFSFEAGLSPLSLRSSSGRQQHIHGLRNKILSDLFILEIYPGLTGGREVE